MEVQETLKISKVEALSKSTVNEVEVRYDSSAEATWMPVIQDVSLAQGWSPGKPLQRQSQKREINE